MACGCNDVMENTLKLTNEKLQQELAEKEKLQKMIIRAKREWERTVDALSETVALIDCNHNLVRVNKAMAALFGKAAPEIIGKTFYLSSAGFNNRKQAEEDFRILRSGQAVSGSFSDPDRQALYEVHLTPYFDTDDRIVIGFVYIGRDITNR